MGKDILVKNYSQLKTNDYLISKRQIIHGANGIVPSELDNAIVSNEYLVVVSNNDVRTEFLTLVSRTPSMYRKFLLSSYGVDIEKWFSMLKTGKAGKSLYRLFPNKPTSVCFSVA